MKCQRATIVFPFQAIHNSFWPRAGNRIMSKSYYRVSFSSNSQQCRATTAGCAQCQRATIVFPFQAIHNWCRRGRFRGRNVKELLSCFLFKQFTTAADAGSRRCRMSKSYYRVSFSSNSQRKSHYRRHQLNVKELLSCFLFKQFTTQGVGVRFSVSMSKSYYRVSFSSNSQH